MDKSTKYGLLLIVTVVAIKGFLLLWGHLQFDFQSHPNETTLGMWDRWDAQAYKTIADYGYGAENQSEEYRTFLSHFPPIYPLAVKAVQVASPFTTNQAGMFVSFIAILIASYLLYRLVFEVYTDTRIAFIAALLLNLYPTSYFTIAPYAESLFILLLISSFYWLHKYPKHSYVAGITGALAILTRLLGVAVVPAYLWFVWRKYKKEKEISVSDVLLVFLPLFAVVIYLGINAIYFGDALTFLDEYASNPNSQKTAIIPLKETFTSLKIITQNTLKGTWDSFLMNSTGWNSIFTVFVLMVSLIGIAKRIKPEWLIFSLTYILLFSSFNWGISNARYGLAVFPVFIVLATIKNRPIIYQTCIVFTCFLLYFTKVFTSGAWAF